MFRNTFQSGFLSIFYSLGSKPLQLWSQQADGDGHVQLVNDNDLHSSCLELLSPTLRLTFIACPPDPSQSLGIKLPVLSLFMKNLQHFVSLEVQVMDDRKTVRRFRASNYQSLARVHPHICCLPLRLEEGWNVVNLNFADLTRRVYAANYVETIRVQVHANCRLRRIFFSERVCSDEELPPEFRLFVPLPAARKLVVEN